MCFLAWKNWNRLARASSHKSRPHAIRFSREHAGDRSESAEKQTSWNGFFNVFGLRHACATAEAPEKSGLDLRPALRQLPRGVASVFISYRHENDAHSQRVRAFALKLRVAGNTVTLDA